MNWQSIKNFFIKLREADAKYRRLVGDSYRVNPATGVPMTSGSTLDAAGNPWGNSLPKNLS